MVGAPPPLAAELCCCYCDLGTDYCCDHLCVTFTEQHLWPQAIALATMNTSLLNTYSHAEYLGGHVAKLGCVKLPTDSGHYHGQLGKPAQPLTQVLQGRAVDHFTH